MWRQEIECRGDADGDTATVGKQNPPLVAKLVKDLRLACSCSERQVPGGPTVTENPVIELKKLKCILDVEQSGAPELVEDASPATESIAVRGRDRRAALGKSLLVVLGQDILKRGILEHDLLDRALPTLRPKAQRVAETRMAAPDHVEHKSLAQPLSDPVGNVVK